MLPEWWLSNSGQVAQTGPEYSQRKDEDNRTLGEIFFYLTDELTDITFGESFQIILRAMFEGIYAVFQVTEEQIDTFINIFVDQLPDFLQKSLARSAAWA